MDNLTINDFFCGCGGVGIGFQDAGYKIEGAWDFDKFAVESYKENVGDHVEQVDIKDMTWEDIPKANVWGFGFPCQDLSVAGRQEGMKLRCISCKHEWKVKSDQKSENNCPECGEDKLESANRSGLFFEIMRLIDETQENAPEQLPKVLVAENVKGLRKFIGVLEEEYRKRGYTAHIELYNSKHWGVPQNRERYYIVGIREGEGKGFKMPVEDKDPSRIPKLSTILESKVDEKYYISDDKAQTIIKQALERLEKLGKVHAATTPDIINKKQNGRRAKGDEEDMFTLTAQRPHGVIIDDTFGYDKEPRIYDETSPTLRQSRQGLKVIEDMKEALQECFTTKDGTAYACNATYQKGIVVNNALRCGARTMVIEEKICKESGLLNPERVGKTLRVGGAGSISKKHNYQHILVKKEPNTDGQIIKVADIPKDIINDNERQRRVYSPEGISPTLLGRSDGPKIFVEEPEEEVRLKQVGMLDMKGNESVRRVYDPEGLSPTLTASQGGHRQPKIIEPVFPVPEATKKGYAVGELGDSINISHINSKTRRGRIGKEVAQTLLTGCEQVTLCPTTYRVRKLTPTEYGRLQAFPMDSWKQVVSDTQAYKQFGNAVTTTVAKAVAEAIKPILIKEEVEEKTDREFDPIEQLKMILQEKEDEADIAALEIAIEFLTATRKINEQISITGVGRS